MVAELQQLARIQQEKISAYEAQVEKRKVKTMPRNLRDNNIEFRTIYKDNVVRYRRQYNDAEELQQLTNNVWFLFCGVLVLFMQAGLTLIEAGMGRVKNAQVIFIKNLTISAASCLGWWAFGWSFAFSGPYERGFKENEFAGKEQFLGHHLTVQRKDGQMEPDIRLCEWFLTWAICGVATLIAGAGVTERMDFLGALIFSFLYSSFIIPIVVAWGYGQGWLAKMNDTGYLDFGGSGIVFMSGGVAALVGAIIAGKRTGRFDGLAKAKDRLANWPKSFQPHSMPMVVIGTFLLWFGWYGIVCKMPMRSNEMGMLAAQVAMNATIAAAASGVLAFLLRLAMRRKYDIGMLCNGILAGLVAISAGCASVECGSALAIGLVGGLLYFFTSLAIRAAKIDDSVDAFAVYGVPGMWGLLAAPLFDWGNGFSHFHGFWGFRCIKALDNRCKGHDDGLVKDAIAANFALMGAVAGWVAVLSAIILVILKVAKLLREVRYGDGDERGAAEEGSTGDRANDYKYEDVYINSSI